MGSDCDQLDATVKVTFSMHASRNIIIILEVTDKYLLVSQMGDAEIKKMKISYVKFWRGNNVADATAA